MLHLSAGVLIGLGLSGSAVPMVIGALGKLLPESWRYIAFGAVTAAGSFGQFLFSPIAVHLMDAYGWQRHAGDLLGVLLLVIPLSMMLIAPRKPAGAPSAAAPPQSLTHALSEAFGHRSYVLLVLGFFTCGFQLAFVTVHLPSYLARSRTVGRRSAAGRWRSSACSTSSARSAPAGSRPSCPSATSCRSSISRVRSRSWPSSCCRRRPLRRLIFGAVTGLLWLSTVPPTSGLVAVMFGTRWLTMLFGFAFFSHQVGGFLGVWLGGIVFERTGSYDAVWWLSVLFGVLSAIINLPIVEKPVERPIPVPA